MVPIEVRYILLKETCSSQSGRGRDLPGPGLSSSPAEDAPEPVSGLRPITHLLLRRCDRRRPALPPAGCQLQVTKSGEGGRIRETQLWKTEDLI